jgi:hypothetical protein
MIFKRLGSTAHCNTLNYDRIEILISYINPKLTVDNFDNPWSYGLNTVASSFSQAQSQILKIGHFYTTLETDARSFGLSPRSNIEKKLVQNPVVIQDKSPYMISQNYPYLSLMLEPQSKSRAVSRSYTTFLDAAGNVGG